MEPSRGGYKELQFFKQATIIHDFTVEFTDRYIPKGSRTKDQMDQAARSGKQNIAEGYLEKSIEMRIKLVGVARASQEELLHDYLDFLRQHRLRLWDMNDPRAIAIRRIAYKLYKNYNDYKGYIADAEASANAMVCLINQTNRLLDQKLRWMEDKFIKEGGFRENLFRRRRGYQKKKLELI